MGGRAIPLCRYMCEVCKAVAIMTRTLPPALRTTLRSRKVAYLPDDLEPNGCPIHFLSPAFPPRAWNFIINPTLN